MDNKRVDMQIIFNELSERNKDIIILVAKSMKIAQEEVGENSKQPYSYQKSSIIK